MSLLMDAIKKAEGARESRELPALSLAEVEEKPAPAREKPPEREEPHFGAGEKSHFDDRTQAGNLFAAKMLHESNSKYLALAALAVIALCAGLIYFWQTSRPAEQAADRNAPAPQAPLATSSPAATAVAILTPPLPTTPVKSPLPQAVEPPKEETKPPAAPAAPPASEIKVERNASQPTMNPLAVAAYQALMKKDLIASKRDYARLYRQDRNNKDAILGLAAIAVSEGNRDLAERYYSRVLEIDPQDVTATAGLVDLKGQIDPAMGESTLKSMIKNEPDSAVLYFSLGNQYSSQSRWGEAQQAYFNALAKDGENADYAFNLAVSLDHLSQPKLALEYYKKALTLSAKGVTGFDPNQAAARIRELE